MSDCWAWRFWAPSRDGVLLSPYVIDEIFDAAARNDDVWRTKQHRAQCGRCEAPPSPSCTCGVHWFRWLDDAIDELYRDPRIGPGQQHGVSCVALIRPGGPMFPDLWTVSEAWRSADATLERLFLARGLADRRGALRSRYGVPVDVVGEANDVVLDPGELVAAARRRRAPSLERPESMTVRAIVAGRLPVEVMLRPSALRPLFRPGTLTAEAHAVRRMLQTGAMDDGLAVRFLPEVITAIRVPSGQAGWMRPITSDGLLALGLAVVNDLFVAVHTALTPPGS